MQITLIARLAPWMLWLCMMATTSTFLYAQEQQLGEMAPTVTAPKLVSPELESVERPKKEYLLHEIISYQIKIKWPELPANVRMVSPQLELENLELIDIGQETVSRPRDPGDSSEIEQILTVQLKAQKPGPAKINTLILQWTQGDGLMSSSLKIPSTDIVIKKQFPFYVVLWSSLAIIFFSLMMFILGRRKKKIQEDQSETVTSLETNSLNELNSVKEKFAANVLTDKIFLDQTVQILEHYLKQKFDWNRHQEDYNALQKKTEKYWEKTEIRALIDLFEKVQFSRFSGAGMNREELMSLFTSIYSFIERKRVI